MLLCASYCFFLILVRPQHEQEDFEEETMEDDEAELTLNKVEEEMTVSQVLWSFLKLMYNKYIYEEIMYLNYRLEHMVEVIIAQFLRALEQQRE